VKEEIQVQALPTSPFTEAFRKIMSIVGTEATNPETFAYCEHILGDFLKAVVERAEALSVYRNVKKVGIKDLLESLRSLGRPVYWRDDLEEEEGMNENDEECAEEKEEDEQEEEEDEEEDEDEDEEEEGEVSMAVEEDETEDCATVIVEANAFSKFVEGIVSCTPFKKELADQGFSVLQSAAEDYMGKLFEGAKVVAAHARFSSMVKILIEPEDLRCVLSLWRSFPGSHELVRSIRRDF